MMRLANIFVCCLLIAVAFAAPSAPLLASDLNAPRANRDDEGPRPGRIHREERVAEFCYTQRQICRKICNLRSNFNDRFDGCPQSCESRELRCTSTACYRWTEPDFLIAERFGAQRCAL